MKAPFYHAQYIMAQTGTPGATDTDIPAPLFRRRFFLKPFQKATLSVVGLGYARFYLNGKEITEDKFLSPLSDYTKNIWYQTYDVTDLLQAGENIAAVICGNGFYNEGIKTPMKNHLAPWRDYPKFLFCLSADEVPVLVSDAEWLCSTESFLPFNQVRSGETFDAQRYDPAWTTLSYDDSEWTPAFLDDAPPTGTLSECNCEPIREVEVCSAAGIFSCGDAYIVDFGKNMSGYVELTVCQKKGDRVTLKYGEEYLEDEGRVDNGWMETWYDGFPFQIDTLICSGKTDTYKPYFTYHGFRYVQIEGLREAPTADSVRAYFVHQDIRKKADFRSSDAVLNYIYQAGIRSTYSNLHSVLTDCPTREKLGWTNDAQASAEQTLINFDIVSFYRKWYTDILLSVEEDGSMPGIVPSPRWGYDCGPVCDCLLYELPYRIYLYTGDDSFLKTGLPYFKTYLNGLNRKLENGDYIWLADWTGHDNSERIPKRFVLDFYRIKALRITKLAETLANGADVSALQAELDEREAAFLNTYLDQDGYAVIEEQTALSIQICNGLYRSFEPLREQLQRTVVRDEYRLTCGMVGVQYLNDALSLCGLQEIAYRMITESIPGYRLWYENGATTLWERWDGLRIHSHNHHMFSNVLGWFFKSLLGIAPKESAPGFCEIDLTPRFVTELSYCQGYTDTVRGRIEAMWTYKDGEFSYTVTIPHGVSAVWNGRRIGEGTHTFRIAENAVGADFDPTKPL